MGFFVGFTASLIPCLRADKLSWLSDIDGEFCLTFSYRAQANGNPGPGML
jgi:hypothetical protein